MNLRLRSFLVSLLLAGVSTHLTATTSISVKSWDIQTPEEAIQFVDTADVPLSGTQGVRIEVGTFIDPVNPSR